MDVFRVVLEMSVDDDDVEQFERTWVLTASRFRNTPGILTQTLAADQGQRGAFTITSDWADEAAFRSFETSSHQDTATAELRRLRRGVSMRTQVVRTTITKPGGCDDPSHGQCQSH